MGCNKWDPHALLGFCSQMSHSLLLDGCGSVVRYNICCNTDRALNLPAGLLRSERDCKDRGFSHNALVGVSQ